MDAGHFSLSRRSMLNLLGAAILFLGLGGALFMDLRAARSAGDDEDAPLSTQDSRTNSHDLEMGGGKVLLLMDQLWASLESPEHLAMGLAIVSVLSSAACFIAADRAPRGGA
jgi:hypothetical protein